MPRIGGFGDACLALSTAGDDEMPRLRIGRGGRVLQQGFYLGNLRIIEFAGAVKNFGGFALLGVFAQTGHMDSYNKGE